jgi:hypothetical protein
LIADWTYICDFDHKTDDLDLPIKDQGLVKSPVRIGPDCWLATKVTVTRGTDIGRGVVIGANSVARGNIPAYAVAAGVPAVVVADRTMRYTAGTARRRYVAGLAEANDRIAERLRTGAPADDHQAGGEKEDLGEGFSSYSPVGHYVPHEASDVPHDRLTAGKETRHG